MVGKCTSKQWTDNARNAENGSEESHIFGSILQSNDLGHQCEHRNHQTSGTQSSHCSSEDEDVDVRSSCTKDGADFKDDDRAKEDESMVGQGISQT